MGVEPACWSPLPTDDKGRTKEMSLYYSQLTIFDVFIHKSVGCIYGFILDHLLYGVIYCMSCMFFCFEANSPSHSC